MKVSILDRHAIQSLDPSLIEAYLSSREWELHERVESGGSVWTTRFGDESVEVLVPSSHDARDFALRISEALRLIAGLEKKSELDLYQEILFAAYDMVVIRIPQSNGNPDLDLAHVVALVSNASEMLLAAACSVVAPQSAFLWRRPRRATDYAETLRGLQVGLDEPTITVLSPIPPIYRQPRFQGRELEPFGRSVITRLASALSATAELIRGSIAIDREVVDSLTEHGISANLYDAILGMLGGDDRSPKLRIEIHFAPVRAEPNPPAFEISRRDIEILQSASSSLRRQAEGSSDERTVITGFTVGLRRPTNARRGQITIEEDLLFGATRRVRVELPEADYQIAARAHVARSRVRVSGLLTRRGRFWLLAEPQGFAALPA